ncbi:MAG TPA: hypothetical protein VEI83_05000, partial [Acidimicrobiales bacterium]|nr:hypothetical protein [Acidimicrobiales bacterium]
MRNRTWRTRFAAAMSLGAATLAVAMMVGTGAASAVTPPTNYPRFFLGKPEIIRDAGSDTTFFMMQKLSDYFEQAGLYGCQLNSAT